MPPVLVSIAKTFISLQQARHDADYDLTRGFDREEVLTFVQDAERAFEDWSNVKDTDDARLYLACFLLWKRWDDDAR